MYAPHTVTLYNMYTETDKDTFTETTHSNITILKGVFLDAVKAANVNKSGLTGADSVDLFIPFSVDARDAVTGAKKRFVGHMEYWASDEKSKLWTLSDGGDTFFVKGIAIEPDKDFAFVSMKHDDVYVVTKIDEKDFGSPHMRHWQVGGA